MTEDDVQAKLNYWIAQIVGNPKVIDANSDAQRPALPYITTNLIMSGPLLEHPQATEFVEQGDTILQTPVRDWFWRFSTFAYGESSMQTLRKIEAASAVLTYHDRLRPLILGEISAIRNVSQVVGSAMEYRANCDIEVHGLARDGLPVDVIETYEFDIRSN